MVAPKQMPLPFSAQPNRVSVTLKTADQSLLTQALAGGLRTALGALRAADPGGKGWVIQIQDSRILTADQSQHYSIQVEKYGTK